MPADSPPRPERASPPHPAPCTGPRESGDCLNPPNPMRLTPYRDELMAVGFGLGGGREARGRETRERGKETRGYEPLALHNQQIHWAI